MKFVISNHHARVDFIINSYRSKVYTFRLRTSCYFTNASTSLYIKALRKESSYLRR